MEKVKQIDGYSPVSGMIRCINGTGSYINREDHIAALKEIFPDWPGEYPTEDGWYYFDHGVGDISLVYAIYEYGKFYRPALDLGVKFVDVDKVQFGPRVPMWRKI